MYIPIISSRLKGSLAYTPQRCGPGGRSSSTGNTITVFGASGFLGTYLVQRLAHEGNQIIIPYRGDESGLQLNRHLRVMGDLGQVHFFPFDMNSLDSVMSMVKQSNLVYNLIGSNTNTYHWTIDKANTVTADNIATACRDTGVDHLVHVSALGQNEQSESVYLRAKAFAETCVLDKFPTATIIRPADMFGNEDKFINHFAKQFYFAKIFGIPLVANGFQLKQPVYVGDVAKGMASLVHDRYSRGKIYELAGPHQFLLKDILDTIAFFTMRKVLPLHLPEFLYRMVGRICEKTPIHSAWYSEDVIVRELLDNVASGDLPGLHDLGVKPKSLDSMGVQLLRSYRQNTYISENIGAYPELGTLVTK